MRRPTDGERTVAGILIAVAVVTASVLLSPAPILVTSVFAFVVGFLVAMGVSRFVDWRWPR